MPDAAERDTLRGVEVPDPLGGDPYFFRPLPFRRARHYWSLLQQAQTEGTGLALPEHMDEFCAEVETTDGERLENLPFNPPEVMQLAVRFLAHTRPGWSPWPEANHHEAEAPPSSTS